MRTNLVRGSECLRPAARGVVRRAARSALRRRTEAGSATTRTNLVCGSECLRPAGGEWSSGPLAVPFAGGRRGGLGYHAH